MDGDRRWISPHPPAVITHNIKGLLPLRATTRLLAQALRTVLLLQALQLSHLLKPRAKNRVKKAKYARDCTFCEEILVKVKLYCRTEPRDNESVTCMIVSIKLVEPCGSWRNSNMPDNSATLHERYACSHGGRFERLRTPALVDSRLPGLRCPQHRLLASDLQTPYAAT